MPTQQRPAGSRGPRCRTTKKMKTQHAAIILARRHPPASAKTSGFKAVTVTTTVFQCLLSPESPVHFPPAGIWCELESQLEVSTFVLLQTRTHHQKPPAAAAELWIGEKSMWFELCLQQQQPQPQQQQQCIFEVVKSTFYLFICLSVHSRAIVFTWNSSMGAHKTACNSRCPPPPSKIKRLSPPLQDTIRVNCAAQDPSPLCFEPRETESHNSSSSRLDFFITQVQPCPVQHSAAAAAAEEEGSSSSSGSTSRGTQQRFNRAHFRPIQALSCCSFHKWDGYQKQPPPAASPAGSTHTHSSLDFKAVTEDFVPPATARPPPCPNPTTPACIRWRARRTWTRTSQL